MDLNLQNHVCLITGGASGIGRATAELFASEGAGVAIWDVNEQAARAAQDIAEKYSVPCLGITVDVTHEQRVADALEHTAQRLGPVEHVVHAAAIGSGKFGFPFTNLQPGDWKRVLDVNILGMVNIAHAVVPQMISRRSGTLVFIASVAGQIGSQTDPPYSASKAANINFAQCLAKDLAPHGVRVNTVCPGMVQTPLNQSVWQAWYDQSPPHEQLPYEEWASRKIRAVVPLGTWQTPQSIADMIVFLSSRRADHITGQTINIDGGFVMHW